MYKLNAVEALRAQILLENALRKLQFLSCLSGTSGANNQRDELTQFMGDEISRIIQEQRQLEKQYESLIMKRGTLKGLMHKKEFQAVQREIQEVAHRLRESNKALCRNLKENPNAQGNLVKMQHERFRVQALLEDTKGELLDTMGFQQLVSRVEAERKDQELLHEVKKKEREASQHVKQLEVELQNEYVEHEKEMRTAMTEIKTLKEELQKNKTESAILLATEEKKLKAQESALQRALQQKELHLTNELNELEKQKRLELTAHERGKDFLEKKYTELMQQKGEWEDKVKTDVQEQQERLGKIREESSHTRGKLEKLREDMEGETKQKEETEKEQNFLLELERLRQDQERKQTETIFFLQSEGRAYIARLVARAAKSKGKKGKKGKKK